MELELLVAAGGTTGSWSVASFASGRSGSGSRTSSWLEAGKDGGVGGDRGEFLVGGFGPRGRSRGESERVAAARRKRWDISPSF